VEVQDDLKHQHEKELVSMTRQLQILTQTVSQKEDECQRWKCFPLSTVYTSLLEALTEVERTNRQPSIQIKDSIKSDSPITEKVHSLKLRMSYRLKFFLIKCTFCGFGHV